MKQVTREQWTTALRSGNYNQGKYRLYTKSENSYCCLGVLCDLAGAEIREVVQLLRQVGISYTDQSKLINMNDTFRNSFQEIADYIDGLPIKDW